MLHVLAGLVEEGVLVLEEPQGAPETGADVRERLGGPLDQALLFLAANAMLIG